MSDTTSLPPGWIRLQTEDGRPYYHCRTTGETSWKLTQQQACSTARPQPQPSPQISPSASGKANMFSLQQLVANARVRQDGQSLFELERDKLLRITLNAHTAKFSWIKAGSMIARHGQLKFSRQSIRKQGFSKIMKKAFTGEGMTLVKCEGNGVAYCADQGKIVSIIHLSNERLYLNGNDVLALSSSLQYDIKLMSAAAMLAGGLFNVQVSGTGLVAFTCHGSVVALEATPQRPIYTDPNATVAWTHMPTIKTDLTMKTFIGRGSGEEFQMEFTQGYVVVQPFEEKYMVGSELQ